MQSDSRRGMCRVMAVSQKRTNICKYVSTFVRLFSVVFFLSHRPPDGFFVIKAKVYVYVHCMAVFPSGVPCLILLARTVQYEYCRHDRRSLPTRRQIIYYAH